MKKVNCQWINAIVIVVIALSGLSCAHEKAANRNTPAAPAEHEQMLQEVRKGIEESKKVVVARVNGADITMYDLTKRANQIAPQYVKQGEKLTPETLQKLKSEALDVLIFRELAIQEAVRQGMKVDPALIERDIATLQSKTGSPDEFKKTLNMTGETEETLRKELERDRLFLMIADKEVFKKVAVDESAIKDAYETKKEQFFMPEEFYIEDIVISIGSDEPEAMKRAEELLSLIRCTATTPLRFPVIRPSP